MLNKDFWKKHLENLKAAESAIGEKGLMEIEEASTLYPGNDINVDIIADKYKLKDVTTQHAIRAARCAFESINSTFPSWREEMKEQKRMTRKGHPAKKQHTYSYRSMQSLVHHLNMRRAEELTNHVEGWNSRVNIEWVEAENCGINQSEVECNERKSSKYYGIFWNIQVRAQKLYTRDMPGERRNINGLITLSAIKIPTANDNHKIWRCCWLERSRGATWRHRKGFIAKGYGHLVHGGTVKIALDSLYCRVRVEEERNLNMKIFREATDPYYDRTPLAS